MNKFEKMVCKVLRIEIPEPLPTTTLDLPPAVIASAIVGIKQQLCGIESSIISERRHAEVSRLRAIEADKDAKVNLEKSRDAQDRADNLSAQRTSLVETLKSMGETWS